MDKLTIMVKNPTLHRRAASSISYKIRTSITQGQSKSKIFSDHPTTDLFNLSKETPFLMLTINNNLKMPYETCTKSTTMSLSTH